MSCLSLWIALSLLKFVA